MDLQARPEAVCPYQHARSVSAESNCDDGTFHCCRHHLPKLEELALANCGTVEKREVLRQHLATLDGAELTTLVCSQLRCGSGCYLRILCRGDGCSGFCAVLCFDREYQWTLCTHVYSSRGPAPDGTSHMYHASGRLACRWRL